jgi:serine/threonine protein kinase
VAILPGTRLGSYEVVAQIGAGGMGEVYRAHDTKLARDVAIKVLPANFVNDPERLSRFQREARMLAALNHPNIATIHGLEQSGSTVCLIMELVPGETLADRVKAGPLPIEEALKIAAQIAEALEAAHEKNIIHRDLKPANVRVTPEGKVKVLDFGLARAFEGDAANEGMNNSPTLSRAATMQGVILGTAAYMSPEQARGKQVDKRTDIWAFGCVLYEMLAGQQAFDGEDVTEILAAVVKTDPDWSRLAPSTSTKIFDLLRRCLQEDKTLRMQAAGDARIEIQEALSSPSPKEQGNVDAARIGWWLKLLVASAVIFMGIFVGLTVWNLKPSAVPSIKPVSRFTIPFAPDQSVGTSDITGIALALSPDGTKLAYVASEKGTQRIYLRSLDSLEATAISGTEGGGGPFFSPDGQWLGFFAGGKLRKVSVNGGAAVAIADVAGYSLGGSWDSQGTIIFGGFAGIQQISDGGGTPQYVTHREPGEAAHAWPEFLPNEQAILFTVGSGRPPLVALQRLRSGKRQNLFSGGTPHLTLSGQLVYAQAGTLMAAPFDAQKLAVTGAAIPVVQGLLQSPITGAAQYSISSTGTLAYLPGSAAAQSKLVLVSRKGVEQPLDTPSHAYLDPRLSPDGRTIAVGTSDDGLQIALFDPSRKTLSPLTFQGSNRVTVWTPDGKHIVFWSDTTGTANLYWMRADGSGGREQLRSSNYLDIPFSFSPDGQLLSFVELNPATGEEIWVLRMNDRKAQLFLGAATAPSFSPDGHWLAYVSEESGRREVYVQPYPGPGGKYQISTEGGTEPLWNHNGRELFYRDEDKMMAVDIFTQPSFAAGKPRQLFQGDYVLNYFAGPYYDVSSDGQQFLMLKPVEQAQAAPPQINVVLNWFQELKKKVPGRKE